MGLGESILFATVMALIEEINENKGYNDGTIASTCDNEIEISFDFNNAEVKDKLVVMANKLFSKADEVCGTTSDLDTDLLITSVINMIIFECIDEVDADYELQQEIYEFALEYCNIQRNFTWDELHSDDHQFKLSLNELSEITLDTIFLTSTKGNGEAISSQIIRLIVELMLYAEDAIIKRFPSITLQKRPPVIALDKIITAMKKEMHRLELEDSSLREEVSETEDNEKVAMLRNEAREALSCENMNRAATCFGEILKIVPDDWEALIYSELCLLFSTSHLSVTDIPANTTKISDCISKAIPLSKKQIFLRTDLISALSNVIIKVNELATKYFVASMDAYKASSCGSVARMSKSLQVGSVIDMMFVLGDTLEEVFEDDEEIINNLCVACWKIGFDCYENCDMPVPPEMYEHYLKMIKYKPSFSCSKPVIGGNSTVENQIGGDSSGGTGGCYIATAVYGSYDCPQVWTLRRYRDYKLAKSWLGRSFIRVYYAISPSFVRCFGNTRWFNIMFRKLLDEFTKNLIENGYKNTPYTDEKSIMYAEDDGNGQA